MIKKYEKLQKKRFEFLFLAAEVNAVVSKQQEYHNIFFNHLTETTYNVKLKITHHNKN